MVTNELYVGKPTGTNNDWHIKVVTTDTAKTWATYISMLPDCDGGAYVRPHTNARKRYVGFVHVDSATSWKQIGNDLTVDFVDKLDLDIKVIASALRIVRDASLDNGVAFQPPLHILDIL
jgi:hypothetical protein